MHPSFLLSTVSAALMALGAGASNPARTSASVAPEFSGTFFVDGHAAAGAEVLVGFSGDNDHPCQGLEAAATVDANGHFFVPAKKPTMSRAEIGQDPDNLFQNYICFSYKGETLVDSAFITSPDHPYKYIGVCTIPFTDGYEEGMCRWHKEHA